ncbi:MAG: amino acid ABC transporter permease, partial [Cyanobacteria bacterium K_DeepCast_35m_m1_288]|nr:amino acid ABC transporter permease [Cyanobacteria bacterium K_DeepCast_35m_m1_288]
MTSTSATPTRPAPLHRLGRTLKSELFATPLDGVITLVLVGFLLAVGTALVRWVLFQAQWAVIQTNTT